MALSVLVSDLVTQIRDVADMTATAFVTDAEIVRYLDKSYRSLYMKIVKANKSFFVTSYTINVVSNQDTYALPADFFKAVGVDLLINDDNDNRITLSPFNFNQRNRNKTRFYAFTSYRGFRYYFRGDDIVFTPIPDAANTVELWYIPDPTSITATNQTITVNPAVIEDYLILDAGIKCLQKEESDVTVLAMERDRLQEEILQATAERDDGLPELLTDTTFLDDQYMYFPFLAR